MNRREFLRRAGLVSGGLVLAPSILAACAGSGASAGGPDHIAISNWTGYMDPDLLKQFTRDTGIDINSVEDINDNSEYFAKVQASLMAKHGIGRDGFVLTDWMANRMINQVKWVQPLVVDKLPNKKNLRKALAAPVFDPTRKYSMPWASGVTGIAYNTDATGGEIRTFDEFFKVKGTKTVLSEMPDTVGLLMLANGEDAAHPTYAGAQKAFDQLAEVSGNGTIKGFNGNDYVTDLSSGNLAACMAWSGDIAQIALTKPNIKFSVPESGGMLWSDNFMIPYTTEKQSAATEFINYWYDPEHAAQLTAEIQYVSPVSGVTEELEKMGGDAAELAQNPLVVPTDESLNELTIFGPLAPKEELLFTERFQHILGAG